MTDVTEVTELERSIAYVTRDGLSINASAASALLDIIAELRKRLQASDNALAMMEWQAGWRQRAEAAEAALAALSTPIQSDELAAAERIIVEAAMLDGEIMAAWTVVLTAMLQMSQRAKKAEALVAELQAGTEVQP